jgi:UDP-N-acetylglucosamine--N-acetylmuramyl-(pentapeptide) pyrophosphoryl-undecaprenol N-acetylglucosamine transferase
MGNQTTILFAGGGTGGHLYPGISVALAMRKIWPEACPVFLCTQREIDRVILEPTGFQFIPQPIVPPVKTIVGLLKFFKGWRETKDLVRQLVRGSGAPGGYAAGVAVKYCAEHGIPAAIVNPDVIPGKANQYLMRHASAVCCQFDQTREHVNPEHRDKLKTTGCPIRPEILSAPPRAEALRRLELHPNLQTLVVTGASQGAQTVNEAILAVLSDLKIQGWQILHLAGREHAAAVREAYRNMAGATPLPTRVIDFTPEMADVWAVADLVVARSGASTCAELTACGIPSILMPYPFHKDLHQRANAKVLADAGAAILIDDEQDAKKNAPKLRPALEPLLYDATRRRTMAESAKRLGRPDAAAHVAQIVKNLTSNSTAERPGGNLS